MIYATVTGNIGKDAEVKTVKTAAGDKNIVSFSIASNKKTSEGDVTTWVFCKKWGAEKLAPFLTKGTKVTVIGSLEHHEKDGKYYLSLDVAELDFGSKAGGSAGTQNERPSQQQPRSVSEENGDDLPF